VRCDGHVARVGKVRNVNLNSIEKPEGKRHHIRPRHRCEDNIRMDLKGMVSKVVDCIYVDQDRNQWRLVMNTVMNLRVPWGGGGDFLTSWATVSFSRRTPLHGISYFSRFRPPRKHTASQLQRLVCLCFEGTCEHGNETTGFIKGGEFLDQLSDRQLLKNDCSMVSVS
jgi:hypothetical protein